MAKKLIWVIIGLIFLALVVYNGPRLRSVLDAFITGVSNITQNPTGV